MLYLKKSTNSLFDSISNMFSNGLSGELRTDIIELDDKYILNIDIPGVEKDSINLYIENDMLVIEVKKEECNESKNYLMKERGCYSIKRSYNLLDIDENTIKAKLNDGVLNIEINKKHEDNLKKTISIMD